MKSDLIQKLLCCEMTWKEISSFGQIDSYLIVSDDDRTFLVNTLVLLHAIEKCLQGQYSFADLLDWANVIRFSDIFVFEEKQRDCILGVLDRIEESDEEGKALSEEDLRRMREKLNRL